MTGVTILGVATGIFIMNIKVNELTHLNDQLTADLKFQMGRADGLELKNGRLGAKFDRIKPYMKYTFHLSKQIGKKTFFTSIQIGGNFLLDAAKENDIQGIQDLLELGSDVDAKDSHTWTSLHLAAWNGHLEAAELLIRHGAEINAKTNYTGFVLLLVNETMSDLKNGLNQSTPLHFAARNGHLGIVALLLNHGADFTVSNNLNNTPIDLAAKNGHFEVVNYLLQNEWYQSSASPIHPLHSLSIAACLEKLEILDLMLQNGCDINVESWNKVTPLHMAARCKNVKNAKVLIQNRANVNAKTWDQDSTPLHEVAINGNFKIAELLLQNGAEVDAETFYYKQTPLHLASLYGYPTFVEVLLKHGARKDLKDHIGRTPLELANSWSNGIGNYKKLLHY